MPDDRDKPAEVKGPVGLLTKLIAAMFTAVVAPLVVAVGVKYLSPHEPTPGPTAKAELSEKATNPPAPAPAVDRSLASGDLITPNLGENFYSYGWSPEAKGVVRNDRVDPKWFEYVKDPPGPNPCPSIHVLGGEKAGYLGTKREFENYTLYVWWRWGEKTFGERAENARWAAVLLHIDGPDGQLGLMPQAVVVHFREGQAGNIRLMASEDVITCKATVRRVPGQDRPVYDRTAPAVPLASRGAGLKEQGAKGWDGTIYRLGFDEEKFDDRRKEPGKQPAGWNRVQIDCDGGRITVRVGGRVVNEITDCNRTRGRIAFTSQGAEWYIGKIEVVPRQKASGTERAAGPG